jgi:2-keto-4-pentenoate hydratase
MEKTEITGAAELLFAAFRDRQRLATLPDDRRPATVEEGYAIQEAFCARIGSDHAGWKVGATGAAVQKARGLTEPIRGRLFHSLNHPGPLEIPAADFFEPKLEAEYAFRLAADLPVSGAPYTPARVAEAIAALIPAMEICDSRLTDFQTAGAAANIADNVIQGGMVLGAPAEAWQTFDIAALPVVLAADGTEVASGSGANVMGHPLKAFAWLVNHLAARGIPLAAGEIVTTGTCTGVTPVVPGQRYTADFGGLGSVTVTFGA